MSKRPAFTFKASDTRIVSSDGKLTDYPATIHLAAPSSDDDDEIITLSSHPVTVTLTWRTMIAKDYYRFAWLWGLMDSPRQVWKSIRERFSKN